LSCPASSFVGLVVCFLVFICVFSSSLSSSAPSVFVFVFVGYLSISPRPRLLSSCLLSFSQQVLSHPHPSAPHTWPSYAPCLLRPRPGVCRAHSARYCTPLKEQDSRDGVGVVRCSCMRRLWWVRGLGRSCIVSLFPRGVEVVKRWRRGNVDGEKGSV